MADEKVTENVSKRRERIDAIKSNRQAEKRALIESKLASIKDKVSDEQVVADSITDTVDKVKLAAQKYMTSGTPVAAEPVVSGFDKLLEMSTVPVEAPKANLEAMNTGDGFTTELIKLLFDEIHALRETVDTLAKNIDIMNKEKSIEDAVKPKRISVQEFGIMKPNGRVDHTDELDVEEAAALLAEGNIRDVYGNIAIAVVTGDMITDSERIDDANSDGGAKYFDDLYMSMLRKQDSKDYLLEILKSRVDRKSDSPVDRLAKEVKQQHDIEKIMLLKMQLDELQKLVVQKANA